MAIEKIGKYLERLKKIKPPHDAIRSQVVEIIKEVVGADVKKEDIRVRGKTIYISSQAVLKSEIFIKGNKILEKIKDKIGEKAPTEIR